tara:strand:+ start:311 stop:496 length:186 start_codon:yes stop_codon:yes gene_type:complete
LPWILTANQLAPKFAGTLLAFTHSPGVILLIVMAVVLLVGGFMETIAAVTILSPTCLSNAA